MILKWFQSGALDSYRINRKYDWKIFGNLVDESLWQIKFDDYAIID